MKIEAVARLKGTAAPQDMQIDVCNQKTAELMQSLNTNVARVFRLEKDHTLTFGPRHTAAFGEWYTRNAKPIDKAIVDKTTKFLSRMFDLDKSLGKRGASGGTYYFSVPSNPELLVALTIANIQVYADPSRVLSPKKSVPSYIEAYYIARAFVGK